VICAGDPSLLPRQESLRLHEGTLPTAGTLVVADGRRQQRVGENLQAVHESRSRLAEVGIPVQQIHPTGANEGQPFKARVAEENSSSRSRRSASRPHHAAPRRLLRLVFLPSRGRHRKSPPPRGARTFMPTVSRLQWQTTTYPPTFLAPSICLLSLPIILCSGNRFQIVPSSSFAFSRYTRI